MRLTHPTGRNTIDVCAHGCARIRAQCIVVSDVSARTSPGRSERHKQATPLGEGDP